MTYEKTGETKMVTEKEHELIDVVVKWCLDRGLEQEDALPLGLFCRGDEAAQEMIDFIAAHPDIGYDDLVDKAIEIHRRHKK